MVFINCTINIYLLTNIALYVGHCKGAALAPNKTQPALVLQSSLRLQKSNV